MYKPTRHLLKPARSALSFLARQIDIQTSQQLRNVTERRCLLNALQKFGEVATFLPGRVCTSYPIIDLLVQLNGRTLYFFFLSFAV